MQINHARSNEQGQRGIVNSFSRAEPLFSRDNIYDRQSNFTRSTDQSPADALNRAMVNYGLGRKWEHAYEAVELPDALSGIREAVQVAFGRDVRSVAPTAAGFNIFNGVYLPSRPDDVYVNVAADVSFINIAGHELLHDLRRSNQKAYDWFVAQANSYFVNLEGYKTRLNLLLQKGEVAYSMDKAKEELIADFMGDALADPKFLAQLAEADGSKFKQLLRAVLDFLKAAGDRLKKGLGSEKYISDVEALRKHLLQALVAYANNKNIEKIRAMGTPMFSTEQNPDALASREGYPREAFAANALQELAAEDEVFRYPVSKAGSLEGVFADVFPGAEWHGESTRTDEKQESGADQRFTLKTPDTPAKNGKPEVIGKPFEVYVSRDKVWLDVHRFKPGDQGSRIYAAVANYAYNTRRFFGGGPAGVSVDAIKARNKMMLASALRFGTTRHLDASIEQERGIEPSLPPLDWRGSDSDKVRALIDTFVKTVQNNAPDIKHYSYDFVKQQFTDDRSGERFYPSRAAFDDALRGGQRGAARIGAASGRATILIQSLVRSEGQSLGDGGILQAILDQSSSLVSEGGLRGVFSHTDQKHVDRTPTTLQLNEANREKTDQF